MSNDILQIVIRMALILAGIKVFFILLNPYIQQIQQLIQFSFTQFYVGFMTYSLAQAFLNVIIFYLSIIFIKFCFGKESTNNQIQE